MKAERSGASVLVACPDARPPAYQAAIGLHHASKMCGFVTACYYNPDGRFASFSRRLAPGQAARLERVLLRRHDPEIPPALVKLSRPSILLLRLEARLGDRLPRLARATGPVSNRTVRRSAGTAHQAGIVPSSCWHSATWAR